MEGIKVICYILMVLTTTTTVGVVLIVAIRNIITHSTRKLEELDEVASEVPSPAPTA